MERQTFDVKSRDGSIHNYSCLPHPSRTGGGLNLLLDIARIAGPVLGGAIKAMLGLPGDSLEDIDVSVLADSVSEIPERLVLQGGADFVGKVLKYTRRDTKELSKPHEFDTAYTGNYGELILAVGKVLEINFSPFGQGGTSSLSGIWQSVLQSVESLTGGTANLTNQAQGGDSATS